MTAQNTAEAIEASLKRIAIGLALLTISFGISIASYYIDGVLGERINIAKLPLGILVIVIVLPAFIKMLNIRKSNKHQCHDIDNYVVDLFRYACAFAFSITFLALIALDLINRNLVSDAPTKLYLDMVKFISLGSFTSYFFFKLYQDRFDDLDDEFDEGEQ